MENVTHSFTGLFLSHAGLNRFTPNATLLLVLAANAPDIDILALAAGQANYFQFHRHLTHSLVSAPVLAMVLVAAFRLLGRKPFPLLPALLVALAGVLSHLVLDLTNNYGIRLLLPFSGDWLAWDLTAIYDFWIWSFFAVCLAAPILSKLVGGEIGAPRRSLYPSRFMPCAALAFLLLYDGGRALLHARALAVLNAFEYGGAPARRVAAFPNPSNPFRWQGVAESSAAYRIYDVDLFGPFNPVRGETVFKAETTPDVQAANRTEPFRILLDFSRFPVWRQIPLETGSHVILSDIRFPFYSEAEIDRTGKIAASSFHFSR